MVVSGALSLGSTYHGDPAFSSALVRVASPVDLRSDPDKPTELFHG